MAGNLGIEFERAGHEVVRITEGTGCQRRGRIAFLNGKGRQALAGGVDVLQILGPTPLFTEQLAWYATRHGIATVYKVDAFAGLATYYSGRVAGYIDNLYERSVFRHALARAAAIVVTTKDFSNSFRLYRGPRAVIPNGLVDPCMDGSTSSWPTFRGSEAVLKILFVGQLRNYKGIEYLLRACRTLRESSREFELTLLGDGPDKASLRNLAGRLGISDHVRFAGLVGDATRHHEYLTNDVLVLPSILGESFGIVLLEAGLHGMDLIVSDLPGVREVASLFHGRVVLPGDYRGIARSLSEVRASRPRASRFNGALADRFRWSEIARDYIGLYEGLAR